jgi:hypothetical protein
MGSILCCFTSPWDIDADDVGPKASPDPRRIFGSSVREGSLGLVVAVTSSLSPGTEGEPPGALSTANLAKDCLDSLAFDKFLWVLNTIVAFAVAGLAIKHFCDTRRLRPCNDLDLRPSFEEPGNGKGCLEFMFGESIGLYALGVSGNVWLLPERADSGPRTPEASRDPG